VLSSSCRNHFITWAWHSSVRWTWLRVLFTAEALNSEPRELIYVSYCAAERVTCFPALRHQL